MYQSNDVEPTYLILDWRDENIRLRATPTCLKTSTINFCTVISSLQFDIQSFHSALHNSNTMQ